MRLSTLLSGLIMLPLASGVFSQQSTAPATSATNAGSASSSTLDTEFFTKKIGPFSISAGLANGGGAGISLTDDQAKPLTSLHSNLPISENTNDDWYEAYMGSLGYKIDGFTTSKTSASNNASISIDPGVDLGFYRGAFILPPPDCKATVTNGIASFCPTVVPKSQFGIGFSGDLQYRYGTFTQGSTLVTANQALAGGSAYIVPSVFRSQRWLLVVPQITVSYFHPLSTSTSDLSVPSNIKENYIQTEFHTEFGWNLFGALRYVNDQYPIALDVKYDGSRPVTGTDRPWQSSWKLQLSVAIPGSSLKPAVTYQNGTQGGFQYDKQVLFGFAAQFF